MCSRASNLCRGDVHIHVKNESGDSVLTFRYAEVVMALEKIGVHMFDKQCGGGKKYPIHSFVQHLLECYNEPVMFSK